MTDEAAADKISKDKYHIIKYKNTNTKHLDYLQKSLRRLSNYFFNRVYSMISSIADKISK